MNDMNAQIRAAAGWSDPRQIAAEALAAAERAGDASAMRERIALEAGLPAGLAGRLRGNDAGELAADAEALAETLAEMRPTPQPPEGMNARIRLAAGRDAAVPPSSPQPPNDD